MATKVIEATLADREGQNPVKIKVSISEMEVAIAFEGYGDNGTMPGDGEPVVIEVQNGVPVVYIFSDINQERHTHRISLAGAAESNRVEK